MILIFALTILQIGAETVISDRAYNETNQRVLLETTVSAELLAMRVHSFVRHGGLRPQLYSNPHGSPCTLSGDLHGGKR